MPSLVSLMSNFDSEQPVGIEGLWSSANVLLVAGPGGVGKTSMAAALALATAMTTEGKVLVLTVDPARRLADALGVDLPGHQLTQITTQTAAAAGVVLRGELWAGMLDVRAGWDELIARHAPTSEVASQILAHPLYENLTRRFVHSHDYLAMERLHEVTQSGDFDVVILDTPPSRNALDLLDAPQRMQEFFGSRLIRWLTAPSRSRVANLVSQPFQQVADRLLGAGFLSDITEFFGLFQTMEEGFVRHARRVQAQLAAPQTQFVVVATPEAAPVHEARFVISELARRGLHLGAVLANRVTVAPRLENKDTQLPADLEETIGRLESELAGDAQPPSGDAIRSVLTLLWERAEEIGALAARQDRLLKELEVGAPIALRCPILDRDVQDLSDLAELASHLVSQDDALQSSDPHHAHRPYFES
jgi:anion-transporting  ArsA/GET3 family ATPase